MDSAAVTSSFAGGYPTIHVTKDLCEPLWCSWLEKANQAAEESMGKHQPSPKKGSGNSRATYRDAQLWFLIQQRNEARHIRNRLHGEEKVYAHAVYSEWRKKAKRWARHLKEERLNKFNTDLKGQLSLKGYWSKLKRFIHLNKTKRGNPIQALVGDILTKNPQEVIRV